MFTYDIQDGEAIIYHLIDDSIKSIDIPRFIGGYPVCHVLPNIFLNITSLEYIDGVKLKQGVNVIDTHLKTFGPLEYINGEKVRNDMHLINNRFIYKGNRIYRIAYQIGSDYYVCYYLRYFHESIYSYIINNHEYDDRIIYYRF